MDLHIPVIGILRGIRGDFLGPLLDAAYHSGLQAVEVTMNTEGAEAMIAAQRPRLPQDKLLGMGTIRNLAEAKRAIDAGAMFLVTPNTDAEVIEYAASLQIPVVAGAMTPTEVYHAWACGADMVKVFPCTTLGPQYIKDLRGPFDQIPLVAVGGISSENAADFLKFGAHAVGVGQTLFGREAILHQRPQEIADNVTRFIESIENNI